MSMPKAMEVVVMAAGEDVVMVEGEDEGVQVAVVTVADLVAVEETGALVVVTEKVALVAESVEDLKFKAIQRANELTGRDLVNGVANEP